ncbi:MAG: hypothetical protein Q8P67_01715, partial [archaeon]|nr:hypothetical protein [archaeon]
MAENYDGEVDENELHELYVEVADSNGGIAGLGSYVMVSPSMKAQDLKKELEGYLGIEASKQKIWLCLPDDFPLSSVLGFQDPVLQLREDNPDGSSSSISRPHSPRNTSRSTSDSTSLLSSAGSVDRSSRAAPAALMGPAPSAPGSSSPSPLASSSGESGDHTVPIVTTDTFIKFGRFAAANAPEEMLKFCQTLPKSVLILALPVLIAFRNTAVTAWVHEIVRADLDIMHRVQLLVHKRDPFSHIIVPHLADGVIKLCEENAPSFEKGQKHRWVGKHPVTAQGVKAVKVDYVFSSLARPVILSYYKDGQATTPLPPRTICKTGEDIYNETAVQILFRLFDEVWRQKLPPRFRPHVFSFNEVPGGINLGFVELLEQCCDIEDVERGGFNHVKDHEQFFITQCGTILATYLLGIEDRHRENTLFHKPTSTTFPIDFGFMLGLKPPSVNCYCIAFSPHLYKYLKKRKDDRGWSDFAAMFLAGFDAVREEAHSVIALGKLIFRGVPDKDENFVETFLRKK